MARLLMAVLAVLVLIPVAAHSDHTVGHLGLYADQAGTDCMIEDTGGLVDVHIVTTGAMIDAVQFIAPVPACWTGASWVADVMAWPLAVGDTQVNIQGLAVVFSGAACEQSTVYIGKMIIATQGLAPPCCEYLVLKAPLDHNPEIANPLIVLCSDPGNLHGIHPGLATVNGDASCNCMFVVPVEETTWGRVKSLYE